MSPADVSERTCDSGLGLNFENLELSLSRETLLLSRFQFDNLKLGPSCTVFYSAPANYRTVHLIIFQILCFCWDQTIDKFDKSLIKVFFF